MTIKYFLILFICYLPVYLALLFYLRTKIPGYTARAHMVSFLATSHEPWRSIFNISTILYGALSIILPAGLHSVHGSDESISLGDASLLSAGIATILVGFFPMNRQVKIHNAAGFLAFVSALLTGAIFIAIFKQGKLFSPLMELVSYAVIGISILLGLSLLFHKQESSLLEWMLFLCTIAWNFLLATLLLDRMY